jgi:hypothetical protein
MNSIELLFIVNTKFRALPIERLSSRPFIERLSAIKSNERTQILEIR